MNLIGNCCISNFLLRKWGFGNTNPFTWIDMDFNSLYNILTSYDTIDWEAIELSHRTHPYSPRQEMFELTVDDKVKLSFVHCIFDPNATQPQVIGMDVHYCKIWEYIVQKYEERKDRMLNAGKPPMFVAEWEHLDYDESAFNKILNLDLQYKVVIITYNTKYINTQKDNLLVIYDPHGRGGGYAGAGNRFPQWYADTYSERIKQFVGL